MKRELYAALFKSTQRCIATTVLACIVCALIAWFLHLQPIVQRITAYRKTVDSLPGIQKNLQEALQQKEQLLRELRSAHPAASPDPSAKNPNDLLHIITASRLVLEKWNIAPDVADNQKNRILIQVTAHGRFVDVLDFLNAAASTDNAFTLNSCTLMRKDDSSLECGFVFVFNGSIE